MGEGEGTLNSESSAGQPYQDDLVVRFCKASAENACAMAVRICSNGVKHAAACTKPHLWPENRQSTAGRPCILRCPQKLLGLQRCPLRCLHRTSCLKVCVRACVCGPESGDMHLASLLIRIGSQSVRSMGSSSSSSSSSSRPRRKILHIKTAECNAGEEQQRGADFTLTRATLNVWTSTARYTAKIGMQRTALPCMPTASRACCISKAHIGYSGFHRAPFVSGPNVI